MKKLLIIILSACLILAFGGCGKNNGTEQKSYDIVDDRGVTVSFDKAPEKVISLLPSDTEIVYALGEGSKLIAVSTYCNYPAETSEKLKLESGVNTNIEQIINLAPDLVIFGRMVQTDDQISLLEQAGIKVVVTYAGSIDETYSVIELIGKVFNKENAAADIVKDMKKGFADIAKKVSGKTSKKVYVEISPLEYGLWTCGKGTFQDELLTLVGAQNIFSDVESWGAVSEEQVVSRDPDVIISTVGTLAEAEATVDEIMGRANWGSIKAVETGNVFVVDSDAIQRPGPRLVTAANDLIKCIYGE
jgi:iron complex transport system substrate-binding protein